MVFVCASTRVTSVPHDFNVMIGEELVRSQRHPFRLGMPLQVIFAQIRAVVGQAVFARNHQNTPLKSILAQSLRSYVAGRTSAQNSECASVSLGIAFGHWWCAAVYGFVRKENED